MRDLTGEKFGRWHLLRIAPPLPGRKECRYACICECGVERLVHVRSLTRGLSASCGCLNREIVSALHTKHGGSKTTEYRSWHAMISRCRDGKNDSYDLYGGRGILVCGRWNSFDAFLADMGHKPSPLHQIDRIDCSGHYEPGNCRWATPTQQGRNRRNNLNIEFRGERRTASEWSELLGLKESLVRLRYRRGLRDPIKLLAPPRGGASE